MSNDDATLLTTTVAAGAGDEVFRFDISRRGAVSRDLGAGDDTV